MMIKCQVCNFENQMGSIFCRNCGEKLDMESMRPETIQNATKKKSNPLGLIRSVVSFALFIVVVGVLGGIFLPFGYKEYQVPGDDVAKKVEEKVSLMDAILASKELQRGPKQSFSYSGEEITAFLNKSFEKMSTEGSGAYQIQKIFVELDGDKATLAMDTKLGGYAPVRFTMECQLDDNKEVKVLSAKMGYLPMIGGMLQKQVTDKFALFNQGLVKTTGEKAKKITLKDSKLTVVLPGR